MIVLLAKELGRRLRNMDERDSLEEKVNIGRRFLQKMIDSGYDRSIREEIIKAAIRKHHRDLQTAKNQGRLI